MLGRSVINSRSLVVSVVVTVAAYLLWANAADGEAVLASVRRVGWLGIGAVTLLSVVNYLLRFVRWQWYLGTAGHRPPLGKSCLYYLAGFALTTTPGKAGEAIRAVFLRDHGVPYTTSLAALLSERLTDLISVTIIAGAGIAAFPEFRLIAVVVVLLIAGLFVALRSNRLKGWLARLADASLGGKLRALATDSRKFVDGAASMLGYRRAISGTALGVVAWGAEAVAFAMIVHALGYPLSVPVLAGVYALAMLAGALSFMPGGLGGVEVAMGVMLTALGLDAADVVSATLICRVTTLWFAVLIGLGALGVSLPRSAAAARDNA